MTNLAAKLDSVLSIDEIEKAGESWIGSDMWFNTQTCSTTCLASGQ